MTPAPQQHFALAVYPTCHGYAFVLFEGPDAPFDWGIKEVREKQKNAKTLEGIQATMDRYRPEVLIIEDTAHGSRRTTRIRRLYQMLAHLAATEEIDVVRYTRADIRACFAPVGAKTKYEIAKAIGKEIPAFMHRLPPVRKIWMSEDPRQSLFDAAALGITHYAEIASAKGRGEDG